MIIGGVFAATRFVQCSYVPMNPKLPQLILHYKILFIIIGTLVHFGLKNSFEQAIHPCTGYVLLYRLLDSWDV